MPRDTVAEIKNRLSIQDVVIPYVKLTKAGRSMKGLCPFHKEKTPSFHVSVDRGTFHCFGCGEGGDMFTFIEKVEGVDFKGALALLAEKAGVEVVYDAGSREKSSRLERLRDAMARAAEFYQSGLTKGGEAYQYARARGLTKETIESWQLGYAPDDWRKLLEHLSAEGFSTGEMLAAGLTKEADGKSGTYYDRFRNRLMFPIKDTAGRTVAFTGRALSKDDPAKYLNSPETELYHKSRILFGLDRAKDAIRTRDFTLLVEGQMDLIHAHQGGFGNTVALSGTAFTKDHAKLLLRYSENLMLALDADSAGLTATQKSALAALSEGMHVKVVRLPKGKDPADMLAKSTKEFTALVKSAEPVVDFFLGVLGEREKSSHRLVLLVEKIVLPLIAAIKSPMERAHFTESVARTLGLSPEAVTASVMNLPRAGEEVRQEKEEEHPSAPRSTLERHEERLHALLAAYPGTALAKKVKKEYARITEAPLSKERVSDAAIFEIEHAYGEDPAEESIDELLRAFEGAYVREAYQKAVANLKKAEGSGSTAQIIKAQKEVLELGKRLGALT